jgi:RHH-type proline utilization regulon transcriptional repressor/proline dehydrogenase/delta 1-pyrroline-5-carboxylate dehydrogenase
VLRYRPLAAVILLGADASDIQTAGAAASVTGVTLTVASNESSALTSIESASAPSHLVRVRAPGGASMPFLARAHELGIVVDSAPITGSGDIELPHWLLEQSVSRTRHRYGRLLTT